MNIKRLTLALALSLAAVFPDAAARSSRGVTCKSFGTLSDGTPTQIYRLVNSSGASMEVTDYGCRVVRISVPDRNGKIDDVVQGCGDIRTFEIGKERFFGPVIGRFGNRIDGGKFTLDGVEYKLNANEKFDGEPVICHGGVNGFDRKVWNSEPLVEKHRVGVRFTRLSPDGEEGFPGNMNCTVTYWWSDDNAFRIEYEATTDKPTVVNLSNHTYFNLKGQDGGYVMDHILKVDADRYFPNNSHFVPKGGAEPVAGTPFDMREPHRVDYAIDTPNEHFITMRGFSVCWFLNKPLGQFGKAADLYEPRCGRGVETWTTEPGLLTFTARSFNEKMIGKNGKPMEKFGGMLLETIHFPDSPNRPDLPSTVLRPGETYRSTTEYRFYAR